MTLYICEMLHLMTIMADGNSIQGSDSVDRLLHLRVILEKIRPIENKMRSQIDLLIAPKADDNKEETLKARPNMLVLSDESEEDDDDEEEKETKKYKAPKIMPAKYTEEDEDKEERAMKKMKQRALQSSLLSELRAQYSNAPEEIVERFDNDRMLQKQKAIENYETSNFRRLSAKKAASLRQDKQSDALDKLLEFGDYMGVKEGPMTRKRKGSKKVNGVKSKKFKKSKKGKKR
uniref:Protein SDA1 n=1 Tax=Strongyloides papillosus TaxID=174720 RepID=A0A0N5BTF4_STREA